MKTVSQLLQRNATEISSTGPDEALFDALKLMRMSSAEALPVIESGKFIGVVSEAEHAANCVKGRCAKETPVREVMNQDLPYAQPHQTLEECLALMTDAKAQHLPVTDEQGRIVGLLSFREVADNVMSDREFTLEQLGNYITGRPS